MQTCRRHRTVPVGDIRRPAVEEKILVETEEDIRDSTSKSRSLQIAVDPHRPQLDEEAWKDQLRSNVTGEARLESTMRLVAGD
jgi:hypothetical protein